VQDLAFLILPPLIDDRIQAFTNPTDSQKLLWDIGTPIEPVRSIEQLLCLFEPYAAARICSESLALSWIETKAHLI